MEIGKAGATQRQRIEMRRVDFTAKGSQVGEPPIIGHQHHEVGPPGSPQVAAARGQ